VVAPETDPLPECWSVLAALAACTDRIRLGSLVAAAGFRSPSVLAKMTSTIDVVSHGRLIVGIGAGWCDWEHHAYGLDFPPLGVRMRKLEETIQVLRAMWTQERATFEGDYFQVRGAVNSPKPIQKPHPPILVGGSGEKVTLRITAQYAQAHNLGGGTPEQCAHTLAVLRQHCQRLGTDYDAITKTRLTPVMLAADQAEQDAKVARLCPAGSSEQRFRNRTIMGDPDQIAQQLQAFVDVGVDYFIVSFWDVDELDNLRTFAREVMSRFA
ncbi:MAG: TIGR03560 family F420-dependent LLM class oxidoreductase, partial [Dehalococcoidia bacterium]